MKNPKFTVKDVTLDYIDKKYNFIVFENVANNKFDSQILTKTKIVELPKRFKKNWYY